ncbi:glycoside hydrolase family 25 protein [Paenibacillus pinistramenti]|uniref:glycoside hydrolase family 25 protein n=1 Tax=Paenibacillus pinistramenti TaxID=1768003 RepID=UPI0011091B2F|nr:glycoside hydrolase family 25 protein [Paenibacillus pinistramenti]
MQGRSSANAMGIDVSHHNGTIDWKAVASGGYSFVYIKASESTTYKDPMFTANVTGAKNAGLLVGAYHFLQAATAAQAVDEAANFAAAIAAAGGSASLDLPPVLDYEINPSGLDQSGINKVASAFLTEIERTTSRKPIIYSGNSFAQNFTASLGNYALWVARYNTEAPWNVEAWTAWTFWQYSETGSVPGISGAVDLDVFSGSVTELKAWAAGQSNGEDEDEVAKLEELQKVIEAQEKRIAAMEKKLNMSGNQPVPSWAVSAVNAGLAVGALSNTTDKSTSDFIALQMLKNLGLLDPKAVKAIKNLAK